MNGFFHAFDVRQSTEDVIKRIILVCKSLHKTRKLEKCIRMPSNTFLASGEQNPTKL